MPGNVRRSECTPLTAVGFLTVVHARVLKAGVPGPVTLLLSLVPFSGVPPPTFTRGFYLFIFLGEIYKVEKDCTNMIYDLSNTQTLGNSIIDTMFYL